MNNRRYNKYSIIVPSFNRQEELVELLDSMSRVGAVPMEVKGKQFDPHLHEALSREETTEFEENTITEELRRGYLFKDRLLRAAQVKVAVHPLKKG